MEKTALVCSTTVEGMAAAYRRVLSGQGVAPTDARADALSPWDRRTIAGQFAGVLDEVVQRRSRP